MLFQTGDRPPAGFSGGEIVAKDGTMRGGARIGSGKKAKPLVDKIAEGRTATVLSLPEPPELDGTVQPPVKDYLKERQRDGSFLYAEEIYFEVYNWLKERGCERLVSTQLLEQYSLSISRWIQCEQAITQYGFLAKHPTTQAPTASPYVSISNQYLKSAQAVWYQIFQIVKENCSSTFEGTPADSVMERLLRQRG